MLIEDKRSSIVSQARILKINGVQTQDADVAFESYKPEFYALGAVLIDRIIDRAAKEKQSRPPFGLIQQMRGNVKVFPARDCWSFRDIREPFADTFTLAIRDECNALEAASADNGYDKITSVYDRFKDLADRFSESHPLLPSHVAVMDRGINAAIEIMGGLLEVIPAVYKDVNQQSPQAAELREIAQNSYPLVNKLAVMHLFELSVVTSRLNQHKSFFLSAQTFNSQFFTLVATRNGQRLDLIPEALVTEQGDIDKAARFLPTIGSQRVGCPAMVNFGNESAIGKLWQWHLEIASHIYQRQFPE